MSTGSVGDRPPEKSELRARIRAARRGHTGVGDPSPWLAACPAWDSARVVAGYIAIRGELGVTRALQEAHARGVTVVLPRVEHNRLTLHVWAPHPGDVPEEASLTVGAWSIPEPHHHAPVVAPSAIDVWLVPGVAFDQLGRRLGNGKAYYDRVLAERTGTTIGIAWAFQVVPEVPMDPWDVAMDAVLTEAGWARPLDATTRRPGRPSVSP